MFNKSDWTKLIGGFALGSVGVKMLTSKPAQKLYTHIAAGAFLARDYVMETAEKVQATCSDIAEDANVIVEKYNKEKDADFNLGLDTDPVDVDFNEVVE